MGAYKNDYASPKRIWVSAFILLALLLSACGGGDTPQASDGDPEGTEASGTDNDAGQPSAESPPEEGGLLATINKNATQEYFADQVRGFEERAEELGYEVRSFNVELDSSLAINVVNDAISLGAEGIAITVPDQAIGPEVARLAEDASVPLVATADTIVNDAGDPVPFVGFNNTDMGQRVGESAAQLLNESGWAEDPEVNLGVLSVEVQELTVCMDRTEAAATELEAVGVNPEDIQAVPYDGTANDALTASTDAVTAQPDVTHWVVYACNDEGVLGATNALTNAGFSSSDIIGVGLGANEACRQWEGDSESPFKAALYISGEDVGRIAAEVLIANIEEGTELPLTSDVPTQIVTPENYTDYMSC